MSVHHGLRIGTLAQQVEMEPPLGGLMAQAGIGEVFAMSRAASLLLIGVGKAHGQAHLRETGMIGEAELAELRAGGAAGEILGHYFDAHGRPVASALCGRATSPAIDELRDRMLVAVAGGTEKVEALRAVLRSGLLKGLITDEATGRSLVGGEPDPVPGRRAPSV